MYHWKCIVIILNATLRQQQKICSPVLEIYPTFFLFKEHCFVFLRKRFSQRYNLNILTDITINVTAVS